jgi:hypothetical protein
MSFSLTFIRGISVVEREDIQIVGHCLYVARLIAEKQNLGEGY